MIHLFKVHRDLRARLSYPLAVAVPMPPTSQPQAPTNLPFVSTDWPVADLARKWCPITYGFPRLASWLSTVLYD